MKKMRLAAALCTACLAAVSLAGCSSGTQEAAGTQAETTKAAETEAETTAAEKTTEAAEAGAEAGADVKASKEWKIALITMDSIDQHWVTLNEGAQKAAEELGVSVTFMSPNTKDDA